MAELPLPPLSSGGRPRRLLDERTRATAERLLDERMFDAEVAVHRLPWRSLVFYDTDDSPEMDTILVYEHEDRQSPSGTWYSPGARYRFSREPDGSWTIDSDPGNPWLDLSLIEKRLRADFSRLARDLGLTSDESGNTR